MIKPLAVAAATCLAASLYTAQGAIQVRELFDGLNGTLQGAGDSTTSVGFETGTTWVANRTGQINVANNFNVNPGVTNQMPALQTANGGIWWQTSADNWSIDWWGTRQLSIGAALDMNADAVYYITYNMRRRNDGACGFGFATGAAATSQFLSVGATWNTTSFNPPAARRLVVAQGTLNVGQGTYGANAYSATQVNNDDRNVILIKITTSASGNDTVQAAFFNPTRAGFGALPATEAGVTWDVTHSYTDANIYTHLLAYVNGGTSSTELDAFRMGTSYGDVVQLTPMITAQPVPSPSANLSTGDALSMSVTAGGGYPLPLSFQWYRGATALTDATNRTLQIATVAEADSGEYYVVVTNANGAVTSATNTITVTTSPVVVTTAPVGGTRYAGGRITLSVAVTGSKPITYQWKRDGVDVLNATNATLTLSNLQSINAGSYVVAITNALGGVETTGASVAVLTPSANSYEEFIMQNGPVAYWRYNDAPSGSPAPAALDYAGGFDAANTSVNYAQGVSAPTFPGFPTENTAGSFDGVASGSATTASLMNNRGAFTIVGWFNPAVMPQPASGGRVALFGQNDAAELGFHGTTQLGVWTPNGGFVAFNPSMITAGNWYMLSGVGDGTNITFYLNGNQVARGGNTTTNYGSSSSPFRIGTAVLDNTGNFFNGLIDEVALFDRALPVEALNALYAKAAGVIGPTLTTQPIPASVYAGQTVRFRVAATGTLPFTYYWYRDGNQLTDGGNISGSGTSELTVSNVAAGDVGSYTVLVENAADFVISGGAQLTVMPRPTHDYASLVITNGAFAWWQLNEVAGATAAAEYLSGLTGTYGSATTLGLPGAPTTALPPENTAIGVGPAGSGVELPPLNLAGTELTVAGWIKPVLPTGNFRGIFFSRGSGTVSGLHFGNGSELRYSWNDASGTWGWDSGLVVPTNEWSFVVMVITPTNGTLYLGTQGRLTSAVNSVSNSPQSFAATSWIGKDPVGSDDRYFNGSIDEVALFPRALSGREVAGLFLGATDQPLTLSITRSTNVVADSRTAGWPHDGQNLGASWVPSLSDGAATRSGVMQFSSGTSQQVRVPASVDFNSPTGVISFWMRSAGTGAATNGNEGAPIFDRRTGAGDVIALFDDGSIFIQPEWMYNASSTKKVNDNLWHHIAYVYDQSSNGYVRVYIDGVLDINRANPRAWSWPAGAPIEIGRSHDAYWKGFDGAIDDFRIYNTAMTDSEVAALMADTAGQPAASLMLRLNFDTAPNGVILDWSAGLLETTTDVTGGWQVVPGAMPPWPVAAQGAARFYKARVP